MQFRNLPSVERVMTSEVLVEATAAFRRDWVVDLVRKELDQARQEIRQGGEAPTVDQVAESVDAAIRNITQPVPRPVINATGVIIHTNLGRSPLSRVRDPSLRLIAPR